MDYETDSLELFFLTNRVFYLMKEMANDITGLAYYENDLYMVLVNEKHINSREKLVDSIIDILVNNFHCSDDKREMHNKNINNIVKEVKKKYYNE